MNLKTSHLAIVGLFGLLLLNGENMRAFTAKNAATGSRKDAHKERVKLEKERAKNAKELSQAALERYRGNCIMVVDGATGKESYFQPGTAVTDIALNKPVRDGASVCNRMGDTAIVTNGAIENIAQISAEDWQAFAATLESRGYRAAQPATPK
jgi:hypothetical protein